MNPDPAVRITNFSHLCIAVAEMERSLAFYEQVLGLEREFDVTLDGEALDTVTDDDGSRGRMIGLRVPGSGMIVELLCFGGPTPDEPQPSNRLGYTNMSFNVDDLDAARQGLKDAGVRAGPIADFDGVRMFFVADPDGTPIEIVEYPGGASTNLEYQRDTTR
ncbi:MAG: VOC family protein [Actinomycetota bacterium]